MRPVLLRTVMLMNCRFAGLAPILSFPLSYVTCFQRFRSMQIALLGLSPSSQDNPATRKLWNRTSVTYVAVGLLAVVQSQYPSFVLS